MKTPKLIYQTLSLKGLAKGSTDPAAHGLAPVDQQGCAGDLPGLVRSQEGHRRGDILWLTDPSQRDAGGEPREELRRVRPSFLPQAQRCPSLVF